MRIVLSLLALLVLVLPSAHSQVSSGGAITGNNVRPVLQTVRIGAAKVADYPTGFNTNVVGELYASRGLYVQRFASGGFLNFGRINGTLAAPLLPNVTESLGTIQWAGWSGVGAGYQASLAARASETWIAGTNRGTYVRLTATATGASTQATVADFSPTVIAFTSTAFTWGGNAVLTSASSLSAPNLTGTLPALDGAALTSLTAPNLTGALPAISGASLTSLTAPNLTGALPAISGASLTSLNASNLGSGTVPDARAAVKISAVRSAVSGGSCSADSPVNVTSCAKGATGVSTMTFSRSFSQNPVCTATTETPGTGAAVTSVNINFVTVTTFTSNTAGAGVDWNYKVICVAP